MLGSAVLELYYKKEDGKENYKQSFILPVDIEDYESVVDSRKCDYEEKYN